MPEPIWLGGDQGRLSKRLLFESLSRPSGGAWVEEGVFVPERDIGVCWYLFSHLCTHKCVEQSGGNRGRGAGLTQLPPHGLCQHSARGFILLSFFEEFRYTLVISFVCHARALHDRLQP